MTGTWRSSRVGTTGKCVKFTITYLMLSYSAGLISADLNIFSLSTSDETIHLIYIFHLFSKYQIHLNISNFISIYHYSNQFVSICFNLSKSFSIYLYLSVSISIYLNISQSIQLYPNLS